MFLFAASLWLPLRASLRASLRLFKIVPDNFVFRWIISLSKSGIADV